eukprot:s1011_g24.t3
MRLTPQANLREYFLNDYKGGGTFEKLRLQARCGRMVLDPQQVWQDALDLTQSGVYSVKRAPDEWPDVATLIDNNYRNMFKRDVELKGHEEYASRVAYCIPILANAAMCYDVSIQQTPEMQKEGKPPGVNLAGKLLNEPGRPERQLRCRADATAKRLGPEHDKALLALSRLAWVLEARGAFAEAEPLRRRVLEFEERCRGPEHRVTLEAVHNLASVLLSLGNLSEAEALHRRCLAAHEVKVGAHHPETLTSMKNLAAVLEKQGKLDEAEELQRKALAGRELQLGAHHPLTLSAASNLALVLQEQGKLDEAEGLHRRALESGESQLGSQHPETLLYMKNLALLRMAQGRSDEAEPLFRRALGGLGAQLGTQHEWTLETMSGLAKLLEAKGSLQEAGQLYLRELRGMEELHGPEHEKTQVSRRNWERFQRRSSARTSTNCQPRVSVEFTQIPFQIGLHLVAIHPREFNPRKRLGQSRIPMAWFVWIVQGPRRASLEASLTVAAAS